jgi:hypothetical protein
MLAVFYNDGMSIREGLGKIWPGLLVGAIGWFAAPYVKSKLDGTSLDGLPGILKYWIHVLTLPIPTWVVVLVIIVAVCIPLMALRKRKAKPDLSIIVLPHWEPRWNIGAQGNVPFMSLHFQARFATKDEHSLEIVKAYLKGTKPFTVFTQIIVDGRYGQPTIVHFSVRPVLGKPGKKVTGRVVLIDQYGNEHDAGKLTFSDHPSPPEAFGLGRAIVTCHICRKEIALQDIHPSATFPAHLRCIK